MQSITKVLRLPATAIMMLIGLQFATQSCGNTDSPSGNNNTTDSTKLSIASNAQMTYALHRRDTTGGTYGNDMEDPNASDSVHSVVLWTAANYAGKSNVTALVNTHKSGATDTTFLWQDANGDIYRYNYGVEALNSQAAVVAVLGHTIDVGWVKQVSMSGAAGTTWPAASTTVNVTYASQTVPISITDQATQMSDTAIVVAGNSLVARHAVHKVTASAPFGLFGAALTIDTYVTAKYGTVRNVIHTTQLTGVSTASVPGQTTALVAHN